jgi:hypothetical protein
MSSPWHLVFCCWVFASKSALVVCWGPNSGMMPIPGRSLKLRTATFEMLNFPLSTAHNVCVGSGLALNKTSHTVAFCQCNVNGASMVGSHLQGVPFPFLCSPPTLFLSLSLSLSLPQYFSHTHRPLYTHTLHIATFSWVGAVYA